VKYPCAGKDDRITESYGGAIAAINIPFTPHLGSEFCHYCPRIEYQVISPFKMVTENVRKASGKVSESHLKRKNATFIWQCQKKLA
jgi:hypothetical protein